MQTNELNSSIIDLRNKGFTRREIAKALGMTTNYLSVILARLIKKGYIERVDKKEEIKRRRASCGFAEDTEEIKDRIIQLKKDGHKITQIMAMVNHPRCYVQRVIRGVKPSMKKEYEESVISFYNEGQIYERIAEQLHVSLRDVCNTVHHLINDGRLKKRKTKSERRIATDKFLIELYNSGMSYDEIAAKLLVKPRTVRFIIKGLVEGGQLVKIDKDKALIDLYNSGINLDEISLKLDRTPSTISNKIHKLIKNGSLVRRVRPTPPVSEIGASSPPGASSSFVWAGSSFCLGPTVISSFYSEPAPSAHRPKTGLTERREIEKKTALTLQIAIIQLLRHSYPKRLTREEIIKELELKHPNLLAEHDLNDAFHGAKLRNQIYLDGDSYRLKVNPRF